MTALAAEIAADAAELRHFTDDELHDLYVASDDHDERADILTECERRDAAKDKAVQVRQAVLGEWRDAMHAQFLQAEERCCGNLLSAKGLAEDIQEPTVLWTGSERWAMARASEELRAYWGEAGGRLSLALFKRQLAGAKRQEREERQAASGKPRSKRRAWIGVQGGAVREVPVRLGGATVPAWAAMSYDSDQVMVHPTRDRAEAFLAPAPEPKPPLFLPDLSTGSLADHLDDVARFGDSLTERAKHRAERVASIKARVAALNAKHGIK